MSGLARVTGLVSHTLGGLPIVNHSWTASVCRGCWTTPWTTATAGSSWPRRPRSGW